MYIERYLEEIVSGGTASETAFYTPLSVHILRGLLNYPSGKCLVNVAGQAGVPDVRVYSVEDGSEWVVCEAKLDDADIRVDERRQRIWREQIEERHYITAETVYVLLCAPHTFRVYTARQDLVAGADLDIERREVLDMRSGERLPIRDATLGELLHVISAKASEERPHYEQFRSGTLAGGYIELTADTVGFLRPVFEFALREMKTYCRDAFDRLRDEYSAATVELAAVADQVDIAGSDPRMLGRALNRRRHVQRKYRVPLQLFDEDYPQFKHDQAYAGTEAERDFEDIFVTNTAYVALTRLFFVRICEDIGLTSRKISHEGPGIWRRFVENIKGSYKDLLEVAYKDVAHVYSRLFETTVFDWFGVGNGRLNDTLERILFRLNAFSFARVDRDVLGGIYQYFRPRAERKRKGEFYTPEEVVDYILTRTGFATDPDVMTKRVLDPACGSFTFGVRAVSTLLEASRNLTARNKIGLVQRCLVGRDINPFAVFLSHLSLLFALLDVYRQAKQEQSDYTISGFNIAALNSLAADASQTETIAAEVGTDRRIEEEHYEYVVGNPPFVRNERLPEEDRDGLRTAFADVASGNTDLAAYFLHCALSGWLKQGGTLGMVAPIGLANADNAKQLRALLARYTIREIVSLEWMAKEVFPEADIVPMLLFIQRQEPPPNHKIAVVTGLRSKSELAEAAADGAFRSAHVSEIDYSQWLGVSPTSDWPLDVTDRDMALLQKLSAGPRLASAADVRLGIKLGRAARSIARETEDHREREGEVPLAKGQHVCAFGTSAPEEVIDLRRVSECSDPSLWRDLSFYDSNRGVRNETGLNGKLFRTTRLIEELIPSDTLCCLVPRVYTALTASVADPLSLAANDSVLVAVPRECSAHVLAGVINSRVCRYCAFLTMRAAILLRRRSTWHPRALKHLPWPKLTPEKALRLHSLAKEAAGISERAQVTELDAYYEAVRGATGRTTAGSLGVHLLDSNTVIDADDLSAAPPSGNVLAAESGTIRARDNDTLVLVRMAALASESDTITNHELQNLMLPAEAGERVRAAGVVRAVAAEIESGKARMDDIGEEIDEIVASGLGLDVAEHEMIKQRCSEFPLNVTVGRPRYVWSPDRKRQARRTYDEGERYR